MHLKIEYQPNAIELAKASSLYIEKKPFLLYTIRLVNIMVFLVLIMVLSKMFFFEAAQNDYIALGGGSLWLFGRRPLNEWFLLQRMKRSKIINKPIAIEISLNGIIWSGKGLIPGTISWEQLKYVIQTQNGFILPNTINRFLWLPYRGFQSLLDIDKLSTFFVEKKITVRVFKNWIC